MVFNSVQETQAFAEGMAVQLGPGTVIALTGNLGTGKTTFAQGFARGLGVTNWVTSPTFKLVSEYEGTQANFFHVDCYRLTGPDDFINIGGDRLLNPDNGITLIEWAEIIQPLLPEKTITITFSRIPGKPELREITITGWTP